MRSFAVLAALALPLSPAAAVTVAGTIEASGDGYGYAEGPTVSAPGVYKFSFVLDAPAVGTAAAELIQSYDFFDPITGENYGGNDVPIYPSLDFYDTPRSSGSFIVKVLRPYEVLGPEFLERGFYYVGGSYLDLQFAAPGTYGYTFTADLIAQIPEPAAWLMMTLGLGLVGLAIRRSAGDAAWVPPSPRGSPA